MVIITEDQKFDTTIMGFLFWFNSIHYYVTV